MTEELKGKVALVTGAGRGIGKAIAVRLAHDGANVVVCDKELAYAEHVADKLRKTQYEAVAIRADVSHWQEVETPRSETYNLVKDMFPTGRR